MRTTIDRAGRVVIPKALRDELGLGEGGVIVVTARDGRIEIEPASVGMRVVTTEWGPVIEPDVSLPPLSIEEVRATLDQVRR